MCQKYKALRIAWLKDRISRMPRVLIGSKELTHYREDGKRSRYRRSSKKGQELLPVALLRKELTDEYERLMKEWRDEYVGEPPEYSFPIKYKGKLTSSYFDSKEPCMNTTPNKYPTEYNGIKYRSKNEQMVAVLLDELGIEFKYETELKVTDYLTIHPDLLINNRAADRCFYLEIIGAPDEQDINDKVGGRTAKYITAGLLPGEDFIMLFAPDSHSFDIKKAQLMILLMMDLTTPSPDIKR